MKALVPEHPKTVELREVQIPSVQEGEILVKMKVCGICGTDIEKVLGLAATPPILGHEVAGEVVEVGSNVGGFKVGDRIFVHHHVSCGRCHYCMMGSDTMCGLFTETNIEPGGFSEFFKVPKINVDRGAVLKLPSEVSYEEATFIEPLGCCLRSLGKWELKPRAIAAVLGCGPMGLLLIKCMKFFGVQTIVGVDLLDYRLKYAEAVGAVYSLNSGKRDPVDFMMNATDGRGADIVFVAAGSVEAFKQAFTLVRRGGVIGLFGAPPKTSEIAISLGRLFYDEVSVLPSYSTTEFETNQALMLIEQKKIVPVDLVTHRFDLRRAVEAFNTALSGTESLKILVTSN